MTAATLACGTSHGSIASSNLAGAASAEHRSCRRCIGLGSTAAVIAELSSVSSTQRARISCPFSFTVPTWSQANSAARARAWRQGHQAISMRAIGGWYSARRGRVPRWSFRSCAEVVIHRAMAVAPLSHSARDYVRAFDLVSVCRWRDGRLGVSRNPKGAEQAWWCPAKDAGALVRAANANGKDVAAAAGRLKTPLTDHTTVAQRVEAAVGQIDAGQRGATAGRSGVLQSSLQGPARGGGRPRTRLYELRASTAPATPSRRWRRCQWRPVHTIA